MSAVIDDNILQDLVATTTPSLDDRPDDTFVRAAAATIRPHLELIVAAYREASLVPGMRAAARAFMQNMLDAED